MFRAIRSGDVEKALRLLDTDPTLLEKEERAGYGSYSKETLTPIILTASVGRLDMVKLLVQRGANIHATSSVRGRAALHFAAERGHKEVVAYLLRNGADPMRLDNLLWTPLMRASSKGRLDVVLVLLEHMRAKNNLGQGLEARNEWGWTALRLAVIGGQEEVAAELLKHGARADTVDLCGTSILSTAVRRGHVGVVKLLVGTLGTPALDETDGMGKGLIHRATYYSVQEDMVAYLLGKGLRPSTTDNNGMTPLMYGARRSDPGTLRVLDMLLNHMDTDEVDMRDALKGYTALHWAVHEGHPSNVRVLLLEGADSSALDNQGRTPRMHAGGGQRPECVTVFEWWDGELERRSLLYRAKALHSAHMTHQDAPTRPVPGYLKARLDGGLALPRVEVVEGQQEGAGSEGVGKRTREETRVRAGEEQQERHAMLELVVGHLSEDLFTELIQGFHAPR